MTRVSYFVALLLGIGIYLGIRNLAFRNSAACMYLKTSDSINLCYEWRSVKNPKGYLVLLHMMPATKESWDTFAKKMQREGYASVAIDLRGHGESDG